MYDYRLPLWYLRFTTSDYPFGILDLRLQITPLVSSNFPLALCLLSGFSVAIILKNKKPTRLAESISYYFNPTTPSTTTKRKWYLSKVGHLVDPSNVIMNGSQYVHGMICAFIFVLQDAHLHSPIS
jgi:hypothetical protein